MAHPTLKTVLRSPTLPPRLLSFKIEEDSQNVLLEQDHLSLFLKDLLTYVTEVNHRTLSRFEDEICNVTQTFRQELEVVSLSVNGAQMEIEGRLAKLEYTLDAMQPNINALTERVLDDADPSSQSSEHSKSAESSPRRVSGREHGRKATNIKNTSNTTNTLNNTYVAELFATVNNELGGVKYMCQDLQKQLEATADLSASELSEHVRENAEEVFAMKDVAKLQSRLLEESEARRFREERCLINQTDFLAEELLRINKEKVDVGSFTDIVKDVSLLKRLAEALFSLSLKERIDLLEEQDLKNKESIMRLDRELLTARRLTSELTFRSETASEQMTEMHARMKCPSNACIEMAEHVDEISSELEELWCMNANLANKADTAEVAELREAVRGISESEKDREQAVLFGARCLSCNHVFDDVQPTTGCVDLHLQKQREQLFAEVQKTLRNPDVCGRNKSVKMIAVKVGRKGQLGRSCGMGPFEGRDPESMSYALKDVDLLAVHTTCQHEDCKPSSRATSVPPGTPHQGQRNVDRSWSRVLPNVALKDGPLDYKRSLAELTEYGRSRKDSNQQRKCPAMKS